jgi:hypothetical protein
MALALSSSVFAFQAPAMRAVVQQPAASMNANRNMADSMIGKYSLTQIVYDPLNLQSTFDNNWLREAELKHGRVCMLAITGFLANDAGFKFPGEKFAGISSIDAHDKMVESGHMWFLLFFVGVCESIHASVVIPRLDGDWSGYEPGNYGLDPWGLDTPTRREAELKNGRLAMLASGGLFTQAALGLMPYQ